MLERVGASGTAFIGLEQTVGARVGARATCPEKGE